MYDRRSNHYLNAPLAVPTTISSPTILQTTWDRLGIGLSGLCALHCLALPLLIALLPLWSFGETLHTWLHPVFAVLLIPVTWFAVRSVYREKRPRRIAGYLIVGLALVWLAIPAHLLLGELSETLVTLVGSLFLIAGHWQNWKTHSQTHAVA